MIRLRVEVCCDEPGCKRVTNATAYAGHRGGLDRGPIEFPPVLTGEPTVWGPSDWVELEHGERWTLCPEHAPKETADAK